jgi:hypothetical protein
LESAGRRLGTWRQPLGMTQILSLRGHYSATRLCCTSMGGHTPCC